MGVPSSPSLHITDWHCMHFLVQPSFVGVGVGGVGGGGITFGVLSFFANVVPFFSNLSSLDPNLG